MWLVTCYRFKIFHKEHSGKSNTINEAINVSVQNKAYEYRKSIDEQQKSIMQERIGRAVYNSSRRA